MSLTAIIVDDEIRARSTLRNLLKVYCPEVIVVGEADTVERTVDLVKGLSPMLVFLDIHLPQQDGFKLFGHFSNPPFETIFTTAYSKYSLMALRMSAVDYLLKPINKDELKTAVKKAAERLKNKETLNNAERLKNVLSSNFKKLPLPTSNGFTYINLDDIIFCEANRNYTYFYIKGDKKILVSKNLKTYEEVLENLHFMRVSRSHIVNLNQVNAYVRTNGGEVIMSNETTIPVSGNLKSDLMERLNSLDT